MTLVIVSVAMFLLPLVCGILFRLVYERRWGYPVTVRIDPFEPDERKLSGYVREVDRWLLTHRRNVRLRFVSKNEANERLQVRLPRGNRWIAEHELPLVLDGKDRVLYIRPVDGDRYRVCEHVGFSVRPVFYLLPLAVSFVGVAMCSAVVLAFSFGLLLALALEGRK